MAAMISMATLSRDTITMLMPCSSRRALRARGTPRLLSLLRRPADELHDGCARHGLGSADELAERAERRPRPRHDDLDAVDGIDRIDIRRGAVDRRLARRAHACDGDAVGLSGQSPADGGVDAREVRAAGCARRPRG